MKDTTLMIGVLLVALILTLAYHLKKMLDLKKMYKKQDCDKSDDVLKKLENSVIESVQLMIPIEAVNKIAKFETIGIIVSSLVLIGLIIMTLYN